MLNYAGHPLVDVGIATIAAFAGKPNPADLTTADLNAIAQYMERNYVVDPLKSFLTVAFPNSGFTQPAYEKRPEKRVQYATRVLRAYQEGNADAGNEKRCVFTGLPAAGMALDVDGKLPAGRAFREHIPLITGRGSINFHPYGDSGLPVSGVAMLALQAFPLGCAKVGGRLLAVHAHDPDLLYQFVQCFLNENRKAVQAAQAAQQRKLPEPDHRPRTLLVNTLLSIDDERAEAEHEGQPSSVTAYHLSNSGQGADLEIFHLPADVLAFLRRARSAPFVDAWHAIESRGWQLTRAASPRKAKAAGKKDTERRPRYNVLYEDLFRLPEEATRFIRRYFLRVPERVRDATDPRGTYSLKTDAGLVSWRLCELFLEKVVHMNAQRIAQLRRIGDDLAEYVHTHNDRRLFTSILMSRRYDDLRAALIRVSVERVRRGQQPVVRFDPFVEAFEEGEDIPYSDWRLARDLVLIRMVERLYDAGWLQSHVAELPETEAVAATGESGE